MLADFCLRLACGLIGSLWLLTPAQVNPRFYRVHFLTALGLTGGAAFLLRDTADVWIGSVLGLGVLLTFLASLAWSLEGAPGGRTLNLLTALALVMALVLTAHPNQSNGQQGWQLADSFTSAALLGTATTAMLMGHSYLIAPSMSLTPLLRLLGALVVAIGLRAVVGGIGLWFWTTDHSLAKLDDVALLLPLRWGLGFVAPFVLGVMAWQAAKIRSTQSATGILYVVVIFSFLGELLSQLLFHMTSGFTL
jgi:hypothetical protein